MNRQAAPFFTLRNIMQTARRADSKVACEEDRAIEIRFMWSVFTQEMGRGIRYDTPYLTRKLHG